MVLLGLMVLIALLALMVRSALLALLAPIVLFLRVSTTLDAVS
jgi:hypothetical protein